MPFPAHARRIRSALVLLIPLAVAPVGAQAAEFFLQPIGADGPHTIVGNEIILDHSGQTVTFEIRLDNWDPVGDLGVCSDTSLCSVSAQDCAVGICEPSNGLLAVYQVRVDGDDGYQGVLSPLPLTPAELIDTDHPEYVFFGLSAISAADTSSINYAFGSVVLGSGVEYTGVDKYGGTLAVSVPLGSAGLYTIGFIDDPDESFMLDGNGTRIVPIELTPALLTVHCQSSADCDDGNACTDNVCNAQMLCEFPLNHDPEEECCDPDSGTLTLIDDGNDCTEDLCMSDGSVTHPFLPQGAACGDGTDTECTDPDACDGAGTCAENNAAAGTACGDPADTDCTAPDTCDGAGNCDDNHAGNGAFCDDGLFCTSGEACLDGTCRGESFTCEDDVDCTVDSCDEDLDICIYDPSDALCDNGQFCDGVEICDPVAGCVVEPGSVPDCDDGVACTLDECDESDDICVNTPIDADCDNGLFCDGMETCDPELDCVPGQEVDCDDGIACTLDACDEAGDTCVNDPDDLLCPDDGLFCNGTEFCNPQTGCDSTGSPCGGPCDEDLDLCLCDAPIVDAVGSRYLRITPQPPNSGPQAIIITPDCPNGMPMYVSEPVPFFLDGFMQNQPATVGFFTNTPTFLTPTEWGGSVYVTDNLLSPDTPYVVQADCGSPGNPGLSDPATAATLVWGDVDQNGVANFTDILEIILAFQGAFDEGNTIDRSDLKGGTPTPCEPNQLINLIDVLAAVGAFQQIPYEDLNNCLPACP